MEAVYTALTTAVTPTALSGEFALAIPFIGGMVVFAFGYYVVKKAIKGAAKGKVRL